MVRNGQSAFEARGRNARRARSGASGAVGLSEFRRRQWAAASRARPPMIGWVTLTCWVGGLPGLESGPRPYQGSAPGLFPQDGTGDLRERTTLETVAKRSIPRGSPRHQTERGPAVVRLHLLRTASSMRQQGDRAGSLNCSYCCHVGDRRLHRVVLVGLVAVVRWGGLAVEPPRAPEPAASGPGCPPLRLAALSREDAAAMLLPTIEVNGSSCPGSRR